MTNINNWSRINDNLTGGLVYEKNNSLADKKIITRAIVDSFKKMDIKTQDGNPVMFLVFISAILTTILWIVSLFGIKDA